MVEVNKMNKSVIQLVTDVDAEMGIEQGMTFVLFRDKIIAMDDIVILREDRIVVNKLLQQYEMDR